MAGADADYQKVMKEDLPVLNRSLAESSLAVVVAPPAKQELSNRRHLFSVGIIVVAHGLGSVRSPLAVRL
jgi:hypothetical protein